MVLLLDIAFDFFAFSTTSPSPRHHASHLLGQMMDKLVLVS